MLLFTLAEKTFLALGGFAALIAFFIYAISLYEDYKQNKNEN